MTGFATPVIARARNAAPPALLGANAAIRDAVPIPNSRLHGCGNRGRADHGPKMGELHLERIMKPLSMANVGFSHEDLEKAPDDLPDLPGDVPALGLMPRAGSAEAAAGRPSRIKDRPQFLDSHLAKIGSSPASSQ
jgi:hypothetical protein